MLAITILAIGEVHHFRRKRGPYRLRRLTMRLTMAAMMLFLLGSILVGVRIFHLQEPNGIIKLWVAFWGCILLLIGGIFCLVIADFRLIGDDLHEHTNQFINEIMQSMAEQGKHPKE